MTADAWIWIIAVIVIIFLLFLMVFNLLAFEELRYDHKNPVDVSASINPWVLPEYGSHALLTILFLVTGKWIIFIINAILVGYHVHRYMNRPKISQPGIYDPTEMFNRQVMRQCVIESAAKLGFYMITFFYYLYCMMYALISSD
eukprot:m.43167 g.43167  ORF g.43167 m.43167 type:complete len:144 (-) comp12006_c1_seq2:222-653(-)